MKFSKELKVGLLTLVAGVMLYYGFNFLKGNDLFAPTVRYYALYVTVSGLKVSNPVIINGFSVGRVDKIRILQDKKNMVLVEITVDKNIKLSDSTIALLHNTDIFGNKAIVLEMGHDASVLEPGDTLISEIDKGVTELLQESAAPMADNLGVTIRRINEILLGMEGSGERINSTFKELEMMVKQVNGILGENKEELTEVMVSARDILAQLNTSIKKVDPLLANANTAVENLSTLELQATLNKTEELLSHINVTLDKFNKGQGTVGKLLNEDSLYIHLDKAIKDLDSLAVHINAYPKHFLAPFGKSRKKIERDLARDKTRKQ